MPAYCSPEDLADHDRDLRKHEPRPTNQRYAVAKLVGYCEGIVAHGYDPEVCEPALRSLIAETLTAFEMPSRIEHEADGSICVVQS